MGIPYRDLAKYAALADVSVGCMRRVLAGEPITNRSRARAREWLDNKRLTHLIECPPNRSTP